jgi:lysophospholipase L1-like esterase
MFVFKSVGLVVFVMMLIIGIFDANKMFLLVKKSELLIADTEPFERKIPLAPMTILVLGDSTAYGTGSEKNELSTAGRLGHLYPEASIKNLAVNGLRLAGLLDLISNLPVKEHYDLVLVQIGANDIIRLTKMNDIRRDAESVFKELSLKTDKLVILHAGDIGDVQFFPLYLSPILSKRSKEVRDVYQSLAIKYKANYVNLIDSPVSKKLRSDPEKYYANDLLHLSGEGYGLWFDEIEKTLRQQEGSAVI